MERETTWATTSTTSPIADIKALREVAEKQLDYPQLLPAALPHPMLGTIIVELRVLESFLNDLFHDVGWYGFLGISMRGFAVRFVRSGLPFTRFAAYAPYPVTPHAQTAAADSSQTPPSVASPEASRPA